MAKRTYKGSRSERGMFVMPTLFALLLFATVTMLARFGSGLQESSGTGRAATGSDGAVTMLTASAPRPAAASGNWRLATSSVDTSYIDEVSTDEALVPDSQDQSVSTDDTTGEDSPVVVPESWPTEVDSVEDAESDKTDLATDEVPMEGNQDFAADEAPADQAEDELEFAAGTLEAGLQCVNGTSYTVEVSYGEDALIPAGSQLSLVELNCTLTRKEAADPANKQRPYDTERFVSKAELDKRGEMLDLYLELQEGDWRYATKYLDVTLLDAEGNPIQPSAPVEVTVTTSMLPPSQAGTLAMAWQREVDQPTSEVPFGYEPLALEDQTTERDGTRASFTTDQFGELAVAGIAHVLQSWDVEGTTVRVLGADTMRSLELEGVEVDAGQEGWEVLEAYYANTDPSPAYGTTLWLSAEPTEGSSKALGYLRGMLLNGGELADDLFGAKGTEKPVSFRADEDGFALVWDASLEQQLLESGKVSVEGMMPAGTELSAKGRRSSYADLSEVSADLADQASQDGAELSAVAAYDISLSVAGQDWQPQEGESLTVSITSARISEGGSYQVWHVLDDGTVEVIDDVTVEGNTVTFAATGFSVYVVVSDEQTVTPTYTYIFYVPSEDVGGDYSEYALTDAAGNTIHSQTVKSVDELVVPQVASTQDKAFAGWYEGDRTGGSLTLAEEAYDFDNVSITENKVIDLYAVYREYATVYFHGQYDADSGTYPIAHTRRAELMSTGTGDDASNSATVRIDDLDATYVSDGEANMSFYGWSYTPIETPGVYDDDEHNPYAITPDADGCITVTGETHLYPVYKTAYWLTYYTAQSGLSATYVSPEHHPVGEPIATPLPTTSRDGYTFQGWYTGSLSSEVVDGEPVETVNYGTQITDASGQLVASVDEGGLYTFGSDLYLQANATLYAKWQATYHLVYWKQTSTEQPGQADKTYEYAETVTKSAEIGQTVAVTDADKLDSRYDGYAFGHADGQATIANTKSVTVLNVYYDLTDEYEHQDGPFTLSFADSEETETATVENMPASISGLVYLEPLSDHVPSSTPTRVAHGQEVSTFAGWYLDQDCKVAADLDTMKMPDRDLTLYAAWDPIKFQVEIDPNYGALYAEENGDGSGATFFNTTYDSKPISEYAHVTRNYVESSAGTWYYVNHDLAYGGDRHTYYTQTPGEATEDTTFEYAPGTYTYIGWYEVLRDEDGNEVGEASQPYDFSQRTDHDTKLRLHWQKAGVYYLAYDAGEGELEDGSKTLMLADGHSDFADVVLDQTATAPKGYSFVGWQVRGSDSSTIYPLGQSMTLHADDAVRVSGKEVIYLDAVYVKVDTAQVVYDANGGTVGESVDCGQTSTASGDWVDVDGAIDQTAGTVTVSGLTSNSKIRLSDGTGFAREGATFLGWSDKPVCDDSATFFDKDSTDTYAVDTADPTTLYAVWGVTVTYHLNENDANWGGEWDSSVYTHDDATDTHVQTVHSGTVASMPSVTPAYTGEDGRLFHYWATQDGQAYEAYDFAQPISEPLDLYAYWDEPNTVGVHVVDASQEALQEVASDAAGWSISNVEATDEAAALPGEYVSAPDAYAFAFVSVAKGVDSVSEDQAVTAIRYDSTRQSVVVKYEGDDEYTALADDEELFFVYYRQQALNIAYRSMEGDGQLRAVDVTSQAPTTTGDELLGSYDMGSALAQPLDWANDDTQDFSHYAFAIGSAAPTTANDLSMLTDAADSSSTPTLHVRNTWRGFEYTTDASGDDGWVHCGYDPTLYVIYFTQHPTVIMFHEQTVGTASVMQTEFTYHYKVTQTTTTTVTREGEDPEVTTEESVVYDTEQSGTPYALRDGDANSVILFYESSQTSQDGVTTTVVTAQQATITQVAHDDFVTTVSADGTDQGETNVYTCASDGSGGTKDITFTNTHKSLPVEIHVAQAGEDGIVRRDDLRSADASHYAFDLALGASASLPDELAAVQLFTGDLDTYAMGTVLYGDAVDDGQVVTGAQMGVASIAYESTGDSYELVLRDAGGNVLSQLGNSAIYYLYYPMPQIRYVKQGDGGSLTPVTGSLANATTGEIEESPAITYGHLMLTMNGLTVTQNEHIQIPMSGLAIGQGSGAFRMPPILDDGLYARYLSYSSIGAGNADASSVSDIDVSTGKALQLRLANNALQYSFDGSEWTSLALSGTPTIYAIYAEKGYDLQISKTVNMSASGTQPLFADASFTVTLSSMAITKDSYEVEGADGPNVAATPADGITPGSITMTVVDGTKVRIKGMAQGDYTIVEKGADNYDLTAKTGPITGNAITSVDVADNTTVSLALDAETRVDLTNSPKALCKIDDNGTEHIFYTLQSAVDYVTENMASYTATIEMLTDYLMPAADTMVVPVGHNITLTTAESGFNGAGSLAVITRSEALSDVAPFTNNGTLSLANIVLEGNGVAASQPMIQSAGDLTVGRGTTIRNVTNSGNGGAINATAGAITVNGASLTGNSAASGAVIYNAGSGDISISGNASIRNNVATSGNGGAIYAAGGTISVSGTAVMSANHADSGNGGAIYAQNASIVIDQSADVHDNTAVSGGAIYAATATVTIAETEGVTPPSINNNTATSGDGGAIWVGAGMLAVSGGTISNNTAASGLGGAIYTNSATVNISGTAGVTHNSSTSGGAIYTNSGAVSIQGGSVEENASTTGDGGAIYSDSGAVTMSGGSLASNSSAASGGAIYANKGTVTLDGGTVDGNTAATNGGAVYAGSGSVTIALDELSGNTATAGSGGAIYADSGSVSVSGTTVTGNVAGADGGAIYANKGAVTATDSTFGGADEGAANVAADNGGAIYAGSGNVTVSGGSMQANKATSGNGGAIYAGGNTLVLTGEAALTGNEAGQNGGAVYTAGGISTITSASMTENKATNGAAVFTDAGRVTLDAGSYTGNVASEGGAIGVGSTDARLVFNGNVTIASNTLGEGGSNSNVYLDQDDDAVLNVDTLGSGANIGIYVPDPVVGTRSVPGARFAVYISDANSAKITNDRYPTLKVRSDTTAKKLYWGNSIKVTVLYVSSFSGGYPPTVSGTQYYRNDTYYPDISDAAISELAAELHNKNTSSFSSKTAVYAGAYLDGDTDFGSYLTRITWDSESSRWIVTRRDGTTQPLQKAATDFHRIYIYYAEPTYISIENNTDEKLNISDMQVNGYSVINSADTAGYGMVFAKNGAIRSELLPVAASDLVLEAGQSVNLLIPGGRNMAYTLDGNFETSAGGSVRLRRTGLSEESLSLDASGAFDQLAGTTLSGAGTYSIVFGDDKYICKVVDADGEEHPYSKISDALDAIQATETANPPYTLATPKKATIEMLVDYLLPASDPVKIPRGYDIELTTAAKEGVTYPYTGEGDRATISRDSENKSSMIDAWADSVNAMDGTTLRVNNLIFDGKSVQGTSDGGGISSKFVNVYVDHVDFKNVYASNGGAMLVMFSAKDKNKKATVKETVLEVTNSNFSGCTSTATEASNRLGGGAIVTNAETMKIDTCSFENCQAVDQAGAVFHRVDDNYDSWTYVSNCSFTNCAANAAGGLELDSKNIKVTNCTFEHCIAKQRNGGGLNVYALNSANPSADCWVTLTGCSFNDCQAYVQNGGGFRSTSVYTTVNDCSFTNTSGNIGGGIACSSTAAKETNIYGCTFDRCSATTGGGVYAAALRTVVGDYVSEDGEVVHTSISNCTSVNQGGGINQTRNANNTSLTITNASITGNQTTGSGKNGGGVYTEARVVSIDGSTITDNKCTSQGGGVYAYSYTSLDITDSDISRNTATGNGGGVWFDANDDTNRGKQVLTIKGSVIEDNTSGGRGGGIYTQAKTVTISGSETQTDADGQALRSSISGNTATIGGGIFQTRDVAVSTLTISDARINDNSATNGAGGGVYASVRDLSITTSEISGNSATSNGGGVWHDLGSDANRALAALTVTGSTLDNNSSGANGGGIYTLVKTVEISAHTEEGSESTPTTISNCTAGSNGGGVYQSRNADGSSLSVTDSAITGNKANGTGSNGLGGGVYVSTRIASFVGSTITNNEAVGSGGGIYKDGTNNNATTMKEYYHLYIDGSHVEGNTSGNRGGGIYTKCQLTLRNGTEIEENRLTGNDVENCAGVYLENNRTLYVGPSDATEETTDTIYVRNNTTASGALSDLRLWDGGTGTNKQNNQESAYVYCNLEGEIYVVNAAKVGTWFGSSAIANPDGFSDTDPVFKADHSTLHGVIDRSDESGTKIIWAGPPIAKITDGSGNLLYLKNNATRPAIFDRLGIDKSNAYNSMAAFNMLCTDAPELYTEDGTLYTGNDYIVMMLDSYETSAEMYVKYYEGRNVTFTTAGKNDTQYPYVGSGTRATVTRGSNVGNRSLLDVRSNFTLSDIIIDGGSENGISANSATRVLNIDRADCTVTLGQGATIQNARLDTSNNGAGVYLNTGTFVISGGVIRNCTAKNGGAVYENNGTLRFEAGNIHQCTATANGGGVYMHGGTSTMTGGTISGCEAVEGGGMWVRNGNSNGTTFTMAGGFITNNYATSKGGGIAVGGTNSRIHFSGKVNVSGNTCDASVAANNASNVELNYDSNAVINTNNGGLRPGSYIGVYVNGNEGTNSNYDKHGVEKMPFGTFVTGDNTSTFYSFVNDRNGLKGGIIENPKPNTIYWIQIFSLQITKEVEAGSSNPADPDEEFSYTVRLRGTASATGQLNAFEIDSSNGDYGEMEFHSNGVDATTATVTLKAGESVTAVNLSEGLSYEVTENLTLEQAKKFAALPAAKIDGTIGENKGRTDVDPYVSVVAYTNILPVCKITDNQGNLLYRRYVVGTGSGAKTYNVPAVYTELTGDDGAIAALEGTFYTGSNTTSTSYAVSNGVQVQMLIAQYALDEPIAIPDKEGTVTLTTASLDASQFPKQDAGTTSTIRRAYDGESMIVVEGDMGLVLDTIILDGAKSSHTAEGNGGVVRVGDGSKLTIRDGSTLQNSKAEGEGGAIHVASGATLTMTGGTINRNQSTGDGAGVYVAEGGTLRMSGSISFGGQGIDVGGNITKTNGNWKDGALVAQENGGKEYDQARQDIFVAESQADPASIVLAGNLSGNPGSIWVWAASDNHYPSLKPFALIDGDPVDATTYAIFRNAQPDSATNCGGDDYLTGSSGENSAFVYWSGGFDISFKKVDEYAAELPGATFSLYSDAACTTPVQLSGEDATATSADGTNAYVSKSGDTLEKGTVLFEEVPGGVYYMKETTVPDGYVERPAQDASGNVVPNVYVILVGDAAMSGAGTGVLEDITADDIAAQIGKGSDKRDAAVFLIDAASGKAVATPDIAANGITNLLASKRKVILKKVKKVDTDYEALEGAVLTLYAEDGTTKIFENQESHDNGVFWIGELPDGTYYAHETTVPASVTQNEGGWWYTVTVKDGSVTVGTQSPTSPI